MLIIYRVSDGFIASNSGTNFLYPDGPPLDVEVQNAINAHGGEPADYGEFRLNDNDEAEAVQAILGAESYELVFENGVPVGVTNIVARQPVEPEPVPDTTGFINGLIDYFGIDHAEALMKEYPTFVRAIDGSNWEIAQNRMDKMLADEAVSEEQYAHAQALWDHFNLPRTE
jgi:hypothetical protein